MKRTIERKSRTADKTVKTRQKRQQLGEFSPMLPTLNLNEIRVALAFVQELTDMSEEFIFMNTRGLCRRHNLPEHSIGIAVLNLQKKGIIEGKHISKRNVHYCLTKQFDFKANFGCKSQNKTLDTPSGIVVINGGQYNLAVLANPMGKKSSEIAEDPGQFEIPKEVILDPADQEAIKKMINELPVGINRIPVYLQELQQLLNQGFDPDKLVQYVRENLSDFWPIIDEILDGKSGDGKEIKTGEFIIRGTELQKPQPEDPFNKMLEFYGNLPEIAGRKIAKNQDVIITCQKRMKALFDEIIQYHLYMIFLTAFMQRQKKEEKLAQHVLANLQRLSS